MLQDFIFIKKNGRYERVCFSDLIYVRGMRGYTQVVTESQIYFVLNSMEVIQKHLPEQLFCRVHRSYIVCINKIRSFDNNKVYLIAPTENEKYPGLSIKNELPLGRAFKRQLRVSVVVLPNKLNRYVKKILGNAEFLHEVGLDDD